MKRENLSKGEYKFLVKNAKDGLYYDGTQLYKLDRRRQSEMLENKRLSIFSYDGIDEAQIEWLSNLRWKVLGSKLPNGVAYYQQIPVSVLYPQFFKGYRDFTTVFAERGQGSFDLLRQALDNNSELMDNGIYNVDFAFKGIQYNDGSDVQITNLDGKYIKPASIATEGQVYEYFVSDFYDNFISAVKKNYCREDQIAIINNVRNMFMAYKKQALETGEYNPSGLVDSVEQMKLLK